MGEMEGVEKGGEVGGMGGIGRVGEMEKVGNMA